MKKGLLIISFLLCFINNNCIERKEINDNNFLEEAIPIRSEDKIIGIKYNITLTEKFNDEVIITHIIDSIYHYKSFDNIDNFFVTVILKNNSNNTYKVKVLLKNSKLIKKKIHTDIIVSAKEDSTFTFFLEENMSKYDLVELKFKK